MVMKTILSLLFILLMGSSAMAQNFVFKVLANKGANEVKSTEASWQPLKTGSVLHSGDELKVTENAYLGLMHSSGRTLEITNAGTMNVDELASAINANSSSVASKYADFVMNKVVGNESGNALKATGAVERGDEAAAFRVFLPSSVELLNSNANIEWSNADVANPTYVVQIKNQFDEVIFKEETADTEMAIDFAQFDQKKSLGARLVILTVSVKDSDELKSGDYGISRVPEPKAEKINTEIAEVATAEPSSSLDYIMLASYYENNKLMLDALGAYKKAMELSPEVEDFKIMYADFLTRNGLTN